MRRMLISALTAAVAAAAGAVVLPQPAAATVAADCRRLAGSGRYSDPVRIGAVTQPVFLVNCPPLTSGTGYAVRYFSFSLPAGASPAGLAMTYYKPGGPGLSGVHPRVVRPPHTVQHSSAAIYTSGGGMEGFYQPIGELGTGRFLLGAEKLSSPRGSVQTVWFNVVIKP